MTAYPALSPDSVSLTRVSPAYDLHVAAAAKFGSKARWSRVDFYESNAAAGDPSRRPEGPVGQTWSPAVEAEHRATRERVGLFDLTSFGKFEVSGPGAVDVLTAVCAGEVARPAGRVTYTQLLNDSAGIVGDVTVARLTDDVFWVVTGTAALEHDLGLVMAKARGRADVALRDITGTWCCFGLWGPQAREVLGPLVDIALDTGSFDYMHTRRATIGGTAVQLSRVTFVGELGWEIYAPTEYGRALYEVLVEAVDAARGRRCGYRAIDSLRAEKGYLYLGSDVTADRTPIEAGLERFVRADRDFVGGAALEAAGDPTERLGCLTLADSRFVPSGGETVVLPHSGSTTVTSAGLGHTLDLVVCFAYLPTSVTPGTSVSVIADGHELPAVVRSAPLYDPEGLRLKA